MRPFISLHNHTTFSIGDSLITPSELFETAKSLNQSAIAVTDHGTASGLFDCLKQSKKTKVKLIAGIEYYFVDSVDNKESAFKHLILLAKNANGYKNLLTINKIGFDNSVLAFKKVVPRIDWKILERYSEDLICTTACGNGIVGQMIMRDNFEGAKNVSKRLKDIFGDDFVLELQANKLQRRPTAYSGQVNQEKINMGLKKISQELNIRAIVTTNAHYVTKDQSDVHDVWLCNASGQPITSGNRLIYDKPDFYIKSADEVFEVFERHLPIWGKDFVNSLFENTEYYADKCEVAEWVLPSYVTGDKSQLPDFPYKDEPDYPEFLGWVNSNNGEVVSKAYKDGVAEDALFYRYRSEIGLHERIAAGKIPEVDLGECYENMSEEFDVLEYRGFSSYMLISADFLNWARKNNILIGFGRGSVGGFLTAYTNYIHGSYPKKYGLVSARFINKYKDAYPDIDNDISSSGRDQIHKYLKNKYGADNFCAVSNVNTMTPKPYVKALARIFNFGGEDRKEAVRIGNLIADSISADCKSIKQALAECPLFSEFAKQHPEIEKYAMLCGKPTAWSTHAAGVIISKNSLIGLVPLRRDANGCLVVEYDKERAEENGLIKIDLLGLKTLDLIECTRDIVKSIGKELIPFDPEMEDEKTYEMITNGDTGCVFQLAGSAVSLCKKIKPKSIDDISLINALVRPACKDIINDLIKIRNGEKAMELIHPVLKDAFGETYGYGIYEESLMKVGRIAWDMALTDRLRKLTKEKGKYPEKVAKWRDDYIECAGKKGFDTEMAARIWDEIIQNFGSYSFNKSLEDTTNVPTYNNNGDFVCVKEIKDIEAGCFLRSRDEKTKQDIFVEVLNKHDHNYLPVFEITLDSGESIKCTMNHKFRVEETGTMEPVWKILKNNLTIVIDTKKNAKTVE
jgi:DNA polymerase III subunit alpha